jgi:serine/threonine protein kinase
MAVDNAPGPPPDALPPSGRPFAGRYDILESMGEGALVASYRARDRSLNRIVTLKTLRPEFANREDIRARLRDGLGKILALAHPNIVRTYDVGVDEANGGALFVVEEYVRGIDLKERIRRAAPFQLAAATDTAIAIAEGLEFAQTRGIAHGDVRPQNVLIAPEGQIKLTGFGVAEAQGLAVGDTPSLLRKVVLYRPAEASRDEAPTFAGDVYALGAILYELLTGEPPFRGENALQIALRHAEDPVPSPRQSNTGIPPALDGIVRKALAKRPGERYDSARALLVDLRMVRDGLRYGKPLTWTPQERAATTFIPAPPLLPLDALPGEPARIPAVDETLVMPIPAAAPRRAPVAGPAPVADPDSPYRNSATGAISSSAVVDMASAPVARPEKVEEDVTVGRGNRESGGNRYLTSINLFLFLLVVGGLASLAWMTIYFVKPPAEVVVPNLVGRTVTDAKTMSGEQKFDLAVVDEQFRDIEPEGVIYQMQPAPGRHIREGKPVSIWISKGPRMVNVPDVRSTTFEKARHVIESDNLRVGDYTFEYDSLEPKGNVMRQTPEAGETRPRGTRIDLVLSKGEEPLPTPATDITPPPVTNLPADTGGSDATPSPAPDTGDSRVRTFDIKYPVPADSASHRVRIDVTDRDGTRTVFDETHVAGDKIKQRIEAVGKQVHIRLFDNDQLRSELTK